ncbi:MAG: cell division protein FtsK [Treponema sp.]|nr:cell division protein FtsK [Treponema sp.]
MKKSNKPNIGIGFILLLIAAFFTLTILTQFIDLGGLGTERFNLLSKLGKILSNAYGYSSILIPVFLFVAAISCFASRWNARKSMRLITAIIPFFTAVGTEKICDHMQENSFDDFLTIKLVLTILIGVMLIIIEILLAGIIGDKISGSNKPTSKAKLTETPEEETEYQEYSDNNSDEEEDSPFVNGFSSDEDTYSSDDTEPETYNSETYSSEEETESTNEPTPQEEEEEYTPPKDDPFAHVFDDFDKPQEPISDPTSIITQEEYAALAFTEDDFDSVEPSSEENPAPQEVVPAKESLSDETKDDFSAEEISEDEENPFADFDTDFASNNDQDFLENKAGEIEDEIETPDYSSKIIVEEEDEEESPWSLAPKNFSEPEANTSQTEQASQWNAETEPATPQDAFAQEENAFAPAEDPFTTTDDAFANEEEPFSSEEDATPSESEPVVTRFDLEPKGFGIASDVFADMAADAKDELENGTPYQEESLVGNNDVSNDTSDNYSDDEEDSYPDFVQDDEDDEELDSPFIDFEEKEAPRTTIPTDKTPKTNRAQPKKPYIVPTDLLEEYEDDQYWIIDDQTKADAIKLKETLNQFGISAELVGIKKGPVVTMFELTPAPGVKLSKIVGLQDNIALSLAASSVRIVAPIPGKAAVGIEIPNKKRSIVSFREMIEQDLPEFKKMAVPVILGKDILGKSQIIDIAKTPHLLIAGATGAGKSVCVNSLILSILYKRSPKDVKMILVDPKVVELKLYNDIPHLLTPVITEPKKAIQALQYCLCEMERRYSLLDGMGVRDISSYNKRIQERNICTEKLPYIVVIIDEFADLMATSGRDLESIVARLTAMSRAVGIHLVLATQRPSVNVITGLIKANIPSRIAFMVSSRTDSNIIIDSVGAEKLLGKGDMLYASAVDPYPVRIQGTFESDNDVEAVVDYVKTLGEPEYIDDEIFIEDDEEENGGGTGLFNDGSSDPLYEQALDIVIQSGKASASYLQRRLSIGYNRAARLVEEMEERGIVGPANGSKPREIIHVPS